MGQGIRGPQSFIPQIQMNKILMNKSYSWFLQHQEILFLAKEMVSQSLACT